MKRDWWTSLSGFLTICGIVFVVWASTLLIKPVFFDQDWAKAGQSGDMFGAVNALFSGLAFAGLIFTIVVQKGELEGQRNTRFL